jgi:hypothetical protein
MPDSPVAAYSTLRRADAVVAVFRALSWEGGIDAEPADAPARPSRLRRVVAFIGAQKTGLLGT